MRRDLDLIRLILLELEAHQAPTRPLQIQAEGYSPEQIAYHVKLLTEAGYVDAENLSAMGALDWRPKSLTAAGHDALDAIRNDTVWHKVKAQLKDRAISVPMATLVEFAAKLVKHKLGL